MEMFTAYPLCETLGMNQPPDCSYFNISKVLSLSVLNVQFNIIISAYNKAIIPRSYNIYVHALVFLMSMFICTCMCRDKCSCHVCLALNTMGRQTLAHQYYFISISDML